MHYFSTQKADKELLHRFSETAERERITKRDADAANHP